MSQPEIHDKIRTEVERRLALIHVQQPFPWRLNAEGDEVWADDDEMVADAFALSSNQQRKTAEFIALHDPADAIRRYEYALKVLDRHATDQGRCDYCASLCHSRSGLGCDDPDAPAPCLEITDLAASLGIEVPS